MYESTSAYLWRFRATYITRVTKHPLKACHCTSHMASVCQVNAQFGATITRARMKRNPAGSHPAARPSRGSPLGTSQICLWTVEYRGDVESITICRRPLQCGLNGVFACVCVDDRRCPYRQCQDSSYPCLRVPLHLLLHESGTHGIPTVVTVALSHYTLARRIR